MSKTNYKVGLVGTGYISEYHVAALRRSNGVEIVGVTDVDHSRAAAAAARFGVPAMGSMEELRRAGADVLHILTPPATHARLTLDALDLGCHVLVEKPLAEDVADCQAVERKAEQTGLRVCVNHSLLYDPQFRRLLGAVRSGKLGKIVAVDIIRSSVYPPYRGGPLPPQYRSAGYPFRDLGVHALYLMEALLGPIEGVSGEWRSLGGDPNLAFDEWRAMVRCRNGLGQFQLSWNVRPLQSQIIVQGTRGVLRADLFLLFNAFRGSTPLPKAAERVINALTDSVQPLIDVPRGVWGFLRKKVLPYHGLQELVRDFYWSLAEGSAVPVSVSEATRVVRWTEHVARLAEADHAQRVARLPASQQVDVLVTGASGGLGGAVVRELLKDGHSVRALVRRVPEEPIPQGLSVALGDLGDPAAVDRAVAGARRVIHVGAAMKGGEAEHDCATIVGTRNVIDACLRHGTDHLVHVSSMSVLDWAGGVTNEPLDENSALEPRPRERGNYTRAKLEAEKLVLEAVREKGLASVILRPGQIFGGRIPLLTGAVARRLGKRWLILGAGDVPLPLVYIDDVVDAIMTANRGTLRSGQVIQLVDPINPTQVQALSMAAANPRVIRVPRAAVFTLGKLSEFPLGLLRRQSPVALYRLRSALARRTFRSVNAEPLLGWSPRVGLREGMRRVLGGPLASESPESPRPAHSPIPQPA